MLLRLVTLENLFYVDLTRRDAEEGGGLGAPAWEKIVVYYSCMTELLTFVFL